MDLFVAETDICMGDNVCLVFANVDDNLLTDLVCWAGYPSHVWRYSAADTRRF